MAPHVKSADEGNGGTCLVVCPDSSADYATGLKANKKLERLVLNLNSSIDLNSPEWQSAERLVQGNLVWAHARTHVALILFRIDEDSTSRRRLSKLADDFLSTAASQKDLLTKHGVLGNLFLSVWGYRKLGFSEQEIHASFGDRWFVEGMAAQAEALQDNPSLWKRPFEGRPPDAMLMLASHRADALAKKVKAARTAIGRFGKVLATEPGRVLSTEPFGFRDGIQMPTVIQNHPRWKTPADRARRPLMTAGTLLTSDRLAQDPDAYGSYVVYRKFRQDVDGFNRAFPAELNAATVVGRFKNGMPLSNPPLASPAQGQNINAIVPDLQNDLHGTRCPFSAHIRKVNPRFWPTGQPIGNPLFRRGATYKKGAEQGLHFLAMQSHIANSFGRIMQSWVNNPSFPEPGAGTDALIGAGPGRHVHVEGGEFFFAPSLAFFRKLAERQPAQR